MVFPPQRKFWKWCLGIAGAVFIGALGSGFWQVALAPALEGAGRVFLSLISAGFRGYKNIVYGQISGDFYSLIVRINLIILAVVVLAAVTAIRFCHESQFPLAPIRRRTYLLIPSLLAGVFLAAIVQFGYEWSALGAYHRVLRIASPYLDAEQRSQIESRFAQISNRQDYAELLAFLQKTAKDHGQRVPKFSPW